METQAMQTRLEAKTNATQFERILAHEYHLAPRVAQAITAEAHHYLVASHAGLAAGQVRVNLVKHSSGHGQPLAGQATQPVVWTLEGGEADQAIARRHGQAALRQHRIQRLLDEALAQGAVASQEDLAQALGVSVRTIKRDFAQLQAQGCFLPSRGYQRGIGRGQSHKAQIIGQWLAGATYDQIALHTRHSLDAIQRYIQTFVRIVELHLQQIPPAQIAFLTQTGVALVESYLALYAEHDAPPARQRLADQMARLQRSQAPVPGKKGAP